MKIEGVEFADALRILARKAGVVLKREDPKLKSQRNILYQICQEAREFFEKQLEQSKSVQDYLKQRGLQFKTIKDFGIGYAPDTWNALYKHLTELGYKSEDIEKAGLIIKNPKSETRNPKHYDRFRSRIMFPIFDLSGQVVGFSGRVFGKEQSGGKYINTPETLIYNKSKIIYGLDKAKLDIRKKNQAIVVEGQFDLVMAHQAGSKNAIATSGSALTSDHLRVLKRYAENLIFAFDADTGGESATKRAIAPAQQLEFNIKIALLPSEEKDPAEIIKKNPKKWSEILEKAKPIMEFYFENTFSKYPKTLSVDNKREIAKELLFLIKNIANTIEQAHWLQVLASKLKVEERALTGALRKIKAREAGEEIFTTPAVVQKSRIKELEEHLLGLVLRFPKHVSHLMENFKENLLTTPELKKVFHNLKLEKKTLSEEEKYLTNYLLFKAEHCPIEEKESLEEINCCIKELKLDKIKKELSGISLDIKEAESEKNKTKLKNLTQKFSKLAQELSKLQ